MTRPTSLLNGVGQLVRQQSLRGIRPRRVLPGAKHDVVSDGVGQRVHTLRRLGRLRIRMYAYSGKVRVKARLEESACVGIERLSRRTQYVMHNRRHVANTSGAGRGPSQLTAGLLFLARGALAAAATLALQNS